MTLGSSVRHINAVVTPDQVNQFPTLQQDFYLIDVVPDLWSFPEGLSSKATCDIWLVTPTAGTSEVVFHCFVDKYGHQIHLIRGIYRTSGSYLTANSGIFASGATGDLRVLLSGYGAWLRSFIGDRHSRRRRPSI
jgi:hypothetical protein